MTQSDREARARARAREKARAVCPLGHDRLIVSGDCPGCESITQALLSFDQEREAELAQARTEVERLTALDKVSAKAHNDNLLEMGDLRADLEKAQAQVCAWREIYAFVNWPTDDFVPPYRALPPDEIIKRIKEQLKVHLPCPHAARLEAVHKKLKTALSTYEIDENVNGPQLIEIIQALAGKEAPA